MGAGHAHALVLERWAERPLEGARLTVVTDRTELLYSGMVPGLVAGEYDREELVIDAAALAALADAELVVGEVEEVDAEGRLLYLSDGRTLEYDVASLDVGSVPAGEPDPSFVRAKAPDELRYALERLQRRGSAPDSSAGDPADCRAVDPAAPSALERGPVVVVGGGAAGVELAATVRARLSDGRPGRVDAAGAPEEDAGGLPDGAVDVRLVEEEERLLPGHRPRVSDRLTEALEERGVDIWLGRPFVADEHPAALVVWATGSAAPAFLGRSGLPVDEAGFVRVDDTLLVLDHPRLFAVGDCASLRGHDLPKAGVHAVRQAPVLFDNLAKVVEGRRTEERPEAGAAALRSYEPQSDVLTLLNLGDGTALGTKWGFVVQGRWVRWLKDRIDRRFVERFRKPPASSGA